MSQNARQWCYNREMLALAKGAYLGTVLDLSERDGIIAGVTSYREDDDAGRMHYHENAHLSFVLRGGGIEKRHSARTLSQTVVVQETRFKFEIDVSRRK
jgi:hypothetical protein